jgi:hypothetical protein
MSETNKVNKPISAYQQLSGILNALKTEQISVNDAMNKIQLKETAPLRPYCKVTSGGALALYGITKQPIVLYADQWNKLSKVIRSDYLQNYMKYNESRLKFKTKKIYKSNDETNYQNIEEEKEGEVFNNVSTEF